MEDVDELLGIDPTDERDRLAGELVRADFAWVQQLVNLRKQHGLTQAQVAAAMGRSQSVVSDLETMSNDPRLSTLRRYALAIGAAVKHMVFPHVAPYPLVRPEHAGPVTARSASAGTVKAVVAHGVYVSANGSTLAVGA